MGSIYSHDILPARSSPDEGQRSTGYALLETLRRDPPGAWATNRWEQVQHYNDVIYIAIRRIMDLVGGSSFEIYRRKRQKTNKTTFSKSVVTSQTQGRDEDYIPFQDRDHPLHKLITRPNPVDTFGEIASKIVLQNRLTGVGPLWSVPNAAGKPVELWPLRTPMMLPLWQWTKQYPRGAWRVVPYSNAGWSSALPLGMGVSGAILPAEEVVRFMDPHPLIDWDGFSPLTAGAKQLDVLQAIDESRKNAMDNGLQLDAVLMVPGGNQDQLDRFATKMTEKLGGSRNSRKFAAVATPNSMGTGDKPDLKTISSSPRDMDYSQGWEQMTKFALALFGVPATVAGLTMASSYSEQYAARQQFHDSQADYLGRLGVWLTKVLCRPWERFADEYVIKIKPRPINDNDLREKQFQRQLQSDLITYNEARAKDDLDPVEGGDVPVSLYVKMKEQELMPPQPSPGMPGMESGALGEEQTPEADPLSELLGMSPEGGAVPQPDNPAGEGSGLPQVEKKALSQEIWYEEYLIRKAVKTRASAGKKEGEVWQGAGGKRWFTMRSGRVVPAKNPNAVAPQKKEKAPSKVSQKKDAKGQAAELKKAGRETVATVAKKVIDGQAVTQDEVTSLHENLKHLTVPEIKQLNKLVGAKLSGTKAKLVDELVAKAKGLVGGEPAKTEAAPEPEPATEKAPEPAPVQEQAKPATEAKPKPKPRPAAKPKPAPQNEPVATAPTPKSTPKPAGQSKAKIPTGHEQVADLGEGVVVAKNPQTGDLETHFPEGMIRQATEELAKVIAENAADSMMDDGGYASVAQVAVSVQRATGQPMAKVLAAIRGMQQTRSLQINPMIEGPILAKMGKGEDTPLSLPGSTGLADAVLWLPGGRSAAYVNSPRADMQARDIMAEYEKNKDALNKTTTKAVRT
jgi:phage portal protein BeeE